MYIIGNDYNHRPRGLSPNDVYEIIKEYKSIENVIKNHVINKLELQLRKNSQYYPT